VRNFVVGRMIRRQTNAATWSPHPGVVRVRRLLVDEHSNSAASGLPTNEHFSNAGATRVGDAQCRCDGRAGTRDGQELTRMARVTRALS